jgi:hypothetical protein
MNEHFSPGASRHPDAERLAPSASLGQAERRRRACAPLGFARGKLSEAEGLALSEAEGSRGAAPLVLLIKPDMYAVFYFSKFFLCLLFRAK